MYIRRTTTKHKGRSYTNYLLVDAVRTDQGPRQKVICSLGNLKPRPAAEWLRLAHRVEQALAGQADLFDSEDAEVQRVVRRIKAAATADAKAEKEESVLPAGEEKAAPAPVATAVVHEVAGKGSELVAVRVDEVTTEAHREAGPVLVGWAMWSVSRRIGLEWDPGGSGDAGRSVRQPTD
jgi:hypothetical protein